MEVPFWNIPYPFRDFLIITSKSGDMNNELFKKLEVKSKDINLNIKQISKFDNISSYIISDKLDEDTCYLNKDNIFFSGVCQFDGDFYYGQNDVDNKKINKEIFNSTGIFTSVDICKSEIIIKHDYFGCGLLYYFEKDNYFLISNRYHLLLIIIATIGYKLKINMTKVACNFYSYVNLFGSNISNKMDMEGVYQLPIENYISITSKGYEIKERKEYIDILEGKVEETYEDLLLQAKDEIIENINAIISSNIFNKNIVDLSGGVDSRLVFAGILNIDNKFKDKIEIRAVDVKSSDDLDIALKVNSIFNYPFYKMDSVKRKPISLKDSLNMWSSYFMGTYHRMGISAWSNNQSNYNEIRLSGGMGELYRATGYKAYKKYIDKPKAIDELVDNLMKNLSIYLKSVNNYIDEIHDLLKYEINSTHGKSLEDKFSNFYFIKYRYHFGMRAWEYYHDKPIYFPLMSKSALKAVMLLSLDEISEGKFMIDMTNELNNILIYVDYDSKKESENNLISQLRENTNKNILNLDKINLTKEKWLESQKYNSKILTECSVKCERKFYEEWRNSYEYIYSELIRLYYEIKEYNKEFDDFFNDDFLELIYNSKENRYKIYEMYSKLRSIDEQLKLFNKIN